MSKHRGSVLETQSLSLEDIQSLFSRALHFQTKGFPAYPVPKGSTAPVVCLLFFEPSTRTRMSFQIASYRLGLQVQTMELGQGSSLVKGETVEDTILNFAAMSPDVMIVRHQGSVAIDQLLGQLPMPVLSAGSGSFAHPTQGLLDAYTLWKKWKQNLNGKTILIVGDVKHSRVAASGRDVLTRLGLQLLFSGPPEFLSSDLPRSSVVDLNEGLQRCDAVMGLRVQFERHASLAALSADEKTEHIKKLGRQYHQAYGLSAKTLEQLKPEALIMHPGPVNYGVEFAAEVANDARSVVLEQVSNGVAIRAALLERALS